MDTLGKRIRLVRKKVRLNQAEFAEKLGLESAVAISKYESDQREPDVAKMITISELGNVNLDWLIAGKGNMEKENTAPATTFRGDQELVEIMELLQEHPQDKKQVLKLLRGKKDIKEALESFKIKGFNEEPEPA